ncbi:hypothetical protein M0R45_012244 [Rubus argutus]|uniref:Uncharacterized protein n=1 Tax=Rubus argutus TaxID=59490 RepID=A0AAW1YC56_RUBAR
MIVNSSRRVITIVVRRGGWRRRAERIFHNDDAARIEHPSQILDRGPHPSLHPSAKRRFDWNQLATCYAIGCAQGLKLIAAAAVPPDPNTSRYN